jgi:AAA15 family ATPase/GTPase
MKISKLNVKYFRHIQDQTIEFGDKLTVITGQNSTGKSSLLGWVAQACDFKPNIKTITGKLFQSKYSEIFRFCKEKDYSKEYAVSLVYKENPEDEEKTKFMETRHVPKSEKGPERYRVDFDKRGIAIDFPVIYLGLKRLIPLATEKNISKKEIGLSTSEINLFSNLSKKILILDKTISSEGIKSTNKDILAMKTNDYGHLGNSAGQDNIGQIISALISFKRLQEKQGSNYSGGLLLIDEIDATLYAGSQIHLVKELYKFARNNDVQIIFTTHSLEILEHLSEKTGDDTKINFLKLKNNKIVNKLNPSIKFLINKIKVQTGQKEKIKKIEVVCEDRETELWCKNLLNRTEFKKYLNIKQGPFGEGDLCSMADSKHPMFKEVYFVLDGDCNVKYKNKKLPPRTIILPGDKPPEVMFYNFTNKLKDDDSFWIETDELNFDHQTLFQDYPTNDLSTAKRWFKDDTFKIPFGSGYARLFNRWKKDNSELVEDFQKEFKKILEK